MACLSDAMFFLGDFSFHRAKFYESGNQSCYIRTFWGAEPRSFPHKRHFKLVLFRGHCAQQASQEQAVSPRNQPRLCSVFSLIKRRQGLHLPPPEFPYLLDKSNSNLRRLLQDFGSWLSDTSFHRRWFFHAGNCTWCTAYAPTSNYCRLRTVYPYTDKCTSALQCSWDPP